MEIDKAILLVCRGPSEIDLLQQLQPRPGCHYIVASDDIRVHLAIQKYSWVEKVCYLEQMNPFYLVAADVINNLELVNRWLASLGNDPKGIPRELLFWIRHCEGGMTTQRIQDLLLLLRSYKYLIDTYNIKTIIILRHPLSEWEDEILIKLGESNGIRVQILGSLRLSILKNRLISLGKLIARDPQGIFLILRAKVRKRLKSQEPGIAEKEIVMQVCNSEERHIGNVVPFMKAMKKRGYDPVSLHWRASKAVEKIRQEKLRAEELETYCPMSSLWEAPYRVYATWLQARRRRREFSEHPGLRYLNVPLGPLLWPVVRSFFWEELSNRFRLQQAAKRYSACHTPKAIKVWGGGILPEGSIFLKSLKINQNPLIMFWFWVFHENPYDSDYSCVDLFLASGESQGKYLEKLGVPSQRIVSVGLSRYDHLASFRQKYSPSHSRAYFNIHQDFQHYLLFDSNSALRGYLTIQEQSLVTQSLLNFARGHPAVALMIKPHPTHRPGWLEALIDNLAFPNVHLIDKNMEPYHALNAADILITKFSTIALEAMLFKKPVVSILLDGEERFNIYGDAVERVNSLEALNGILTMIVSDPSRRAAWVENQIKNQTGFLKHYFSNSLGESADIGAEALDKFLQDKKHN